MSALSGRTLSQILDFFFTNSQLNVYAGEREVRPPDAPTTGPDLGGRGAQLLVDTARLLGIIRLWGASASPPVRFLCGSPNGAEFVGVAARRWTM